MAPCPPIVMAGRLWASAQGGESVEGRPCGAGHAVLAWGAEDPLRAGPLEMHGLTWEPTVSDLSPSRSGQHGRDSGKARTLCNSSTERRQGGVEAMPPLQ